MLSLEIAVAVGGLGILGAAVIGLIWLSKRGSKSSCCGGGNCE